MKSIRRFVFISIFISFICMFFSACSGIIGYSVVLWNIPEERIADGEVVPVYLKSNISHVYVIQIPGTKEKMEVPLWKLSEPQSKGKAVRLSKKFGNYNHKYARCMLDGLPIRAESVNTAKQVYRLRKSEIIRVLSKGEGVAPTNGKSNLQGEWLNVLTSNGTRGWCFSMNLKLFEMNADGSYDSGEKTIVSVDAVLDSIMKEKWYPEYFAEMIAANKVNLEYVNEDFYFDAENENGKIEISLPDTRVAFDYAGVTKNGDSIYNFNSTPVQVSVRSSSKIQVRFTDSEGKTKVRNFISAESLEDLDSIIEKVKLKNMEEFNSIKNFGPDFTSSSYGHLSFSGAAPSQRFSWSEYELLVPSVIPSYEKNGGTVELKYLLDAGLSSMWDGVITLKFDGESKEINLLYKKETGGLKLSAAKVIREFNSSKGIDDIIVAKPSASLVMFFKK